jgi:phosphopantetheinyl transferase (holo-ACP synthase)
MSRTLPVLVVLVLATSAPAADPFSIKVTDKAEPPKELKDNVRKLLAEKSVQFFDDKGNQLAEIWFRKELPVKATDAQIQNGLTYQEVAQTTLVGAVRIKDTLGDYRKQKIKAGVYTMRLAIQPMDGDHMGTAPHGEFLLLVPASEDEGKEAFEPEKLHDLSKKASATGHPAVFLLFPVAKKDLGKPPALQMRENKHWSLNVTLDVTIDGKKKGVLGFGLNLIGFSSIA